MAKVSKTKKKRNTFLQGFSKFLIGICGIIALLSSFLSALCPYINPSVFVWTAFFGLGFWLIFFANIIILIVLITLKSRRTLFIPILAILFSIPGIMKSFSFGEKKDIDAQIKVMTYNIGVFRDYNVESRTVKDVKETLANLIKEHDPDVVCLQESGKWPNDMAFNFSKNIGYKYYKCNASNGNSYFSKYPIENVNDFNGEQLNRFVDMKKIKVDKENYFYLINCHFNSFGISKEEIDYINDAKNIVKDSDIYGKSLIRKLINGFSTRSTCTKLLLDNLPEDDIPFVICGDFNDTPLSYTYNQMSRSGLKDAFITTSKGVGKTYCGSLPLLRIDYFWYNDMIEAVDFKRIKETTSDHYPLVLTFNINKEAKEVVDEF